MEIAGIRAAQQRADLRPHQILERAAARFGQRLGSVQESEVFGREHVVTRQHQRALDGILQLADVARPLVVNEVFEGRFGEHARLRSQFLRVARDEMLGEHRNVLGPLRAAAGSRSARPASR